MHLIKCIWMTFAKLATGLNIVKSIEAPKKYQPQINGKSKFDGIFRLHITLLLLEIYSSKFIWWNIVILYVRK